jgi:hypothetical protein
MDRTLTCTRQPLITPCATGRLALAEAFIQKRGDRCDYQEYALDGHEPAHDTHARMIRVYPLAGVYRLVLAIGQQDFLQSLMISSITSTKILEIRNKNPRTNSGGNEIITYWPRITARAIPETVPNNRPNL